MDRSDMLLIGLGGGGGNLTNSIIEVDNRWQGYFINTSITDIKSLSNCNDIIKNYYCISTSNGVGRNRQLGKELAKNTWLNIYDGIQRYNQKNIIFISSLGGGSGSAELSIILEGIDSLDDFDKTITLILIIPSLNSSDKILQNALDTWNEISKRKCVTNMIFVDNNSNIGYYSNEIKKEKGINDLFAEQFDSIFDIPEDNGTNFDEGNLGNILNDKGVLYFYNLGDYDDINKAMNNKDNNSVLSPMYIPENQLELLPDKTNAIICGRYGLSFSNDYNKNYFYKNFRPKYESYEGTNAYGNNLLLISGCYPPIDSLSLIEHELDDRKKRSLNNGDFDFSMFTVGNKNNFTKDVVNEVTRENNKIPKVKKKMKKNLFR